MRLIARLAATWAWVALLATGCNPKVEGDVLVTIDYARPAPGPDCVVLIATDVTTRSSDSVRSEQRAMSLATNPASGSLKVAVAQPLGWSARIGFEAKLVAGSCEGPTIATSGAPSDVSFEVNVAKTVVLTLTSPDSMTPDGGRADAGGTDAGGQPDAGQDAGTQLDGGAVDAGADAGAGVDAGVMADAGVPVDGGPVCDAGLRKIAGPVFGEFWQDLAIYNPSVGQIIAVGSSGSLALFDAAGNRSNWAGSALNENFRGVWVSPATGRVFVAAISSVFELRWGSGTAALVANFPTNYSMTALAGYDLSDGGVSLLLGSKSSPYLSRVAPDGGITAETMTLPGPVYDLVVLDEQTQWAVGASNNHQTFWHYSAPLTSWLVTNTGDPGAVQAVDFVSPTEGAIASWHGASGGFFRWNGAQWLTASSPDFEVLGLAMRDRNNITAVGASRFFSAGFARWDGTSWTYPPGPTMSSTLRRVRTAGGCNVWAVGDDGMVLTTHE